MPHLRPRSHCCALQKNCPAKERSGDAASSSNPTSTAGELRTRRERWFHGSPASILIRNQCPSPISKGGEAGIGRLTPDVAIRNDDNGVTLPRSGNSVAVPKRASTSS